MDPHRVTAAGSGAPGTFSMIHGRPSATSAERVGPTRAGWSRADSTARAVYA